ncbi:MAG: protein disulfide oxidoreductase [Candidatus Aminicenantales bacterium]
MEILTPDIREATKKKFSSELKERVTVLFFTQEPSRLILPDRLQGQECFYCKETRQMLEEVASLTDKLDLVIHDFGVERKKAAELGIDKIPGIVIQGEKDYGIRIFGIPSGYEYASLLGAIIDVSRGTTGLTEKTKEALTALDKEIHIQVFVTPTCPYCTQAVRLAHQFALESPLIRADMVEATEFPHLVQKYQVFGVPKTVLNETVFVEGAVPEADFLDHVLRAVDASKK